MLVLQVETLRDQLTSVQTEFRLCTAQNNQISQQLADIKRNHSRSEKEILDDKEHLLLQVYWQLFLSCLYV